ncbi:MULTISPECIES: hypothetical protein [unclassified Nocardioides]|uniref:hypothetical protein n=1 Tax=unclassified Nocardioides TaxID=2615069 RepID=UPI003623F9C8
MGTAQVGLVIGAPRRDRAGGSPHGREKMMFDIKNRLKGVTNREMWAARGASLVGKVKATKTVWFPPEPVATGTKAGTVAAKKASGSARKTAKKTTGTARKSAGAAAKTGSATRKTAPKPAKKASSRTKKASRAAG